MSRTKGTTTAAIVENLEGRTLMSATPLSVSEVSDNGGTQLRIIGTAGNDQITVKQTSAGLVIGNTGGWTKTVTDKINNLWINAEGGNNSVILNSSVSISATIFAGTGKNVVEAGSGNDTIVSLGSTADTLVGGSGYDTFWTDNSAAEKIENLTAGETSEGAVHRVGGYINAGTITVAGKKGSTAKTKTVTAATTGIREPAVDAGVTYANFSSDPIFASTGPSANDIFQGNVGDCYFLSVLSSVAKVDPARITNSILNMGDGTVIVALDKNGQPVYVREDEELPVNYDGSLAYAGLGQQNCTWVALMEKAFCYVRTNVISYDSLNSGWMDESYAALGTTPTSTFSAGSAASLAAQIGYDVETGMSATYATGDTVPTGSNLIADHGYAVISVTTNSQGNVTSITLRNPWGCDINGNGNGYVTVTDAQAFYAFTGMVSAWV